MGVWAPHAGADSTVQGAICRDPGTPTSDPETPTVQRYLAPFGTIWRPEPKCQKQRGGADVPKAANGPLKRAAFCI